MPTALRREGLGWEGKSAPGKSIKFNVIWVVGCGLRVVATVGRREVDQWRLTALAPEWVTKSGGD